MSRSRKTAAVAKKPRAKKSRNTYVMDETLGKKVRSFYLDPTPEEIKEQEERAAEVRNSWSPAEMARRAGWQGRCEVKQYEFNGRDTAFKQIEHCW